MTTFADDLATEPAAAPLTVGDPAPAAPGLDAPAIVEALEGRVGRLGTLGAALGLVVVTGGITAAGTAGGMGFGPAAGLGAFAGIWSGVGFGFMMGASVAARDH
jgi:hypothetical protein